MKVRLNEIKARSPRVRQSQSPEELDVLAASLAAFNQAIIPVGIRKNGEGYDLVYGHRRLAAAKQAGLIDIEAVEVSTSDDMVKVYGLVENVVREDMTALDIAKALQQIKAESGWTDERIGAFFGGTGEWVRSHLSMLAPEIVKALGGSQTGLDFGTKHLHEIKAGLGPDHQAQVPAVIKKVVEDDLSTRQARVVAETVARASAFGGKSAVARVIARPSAEILATAPIPNVRKPKPKAVEIEGQVLFQWLKDIRVIMAEEGLKAVSVCVSAIARSKEDRSGGRIVLKNLRKVTANILKQIDDVLAHL